MPQFSAPNIGSITKLFRGGTLLHMGCKGCGADEGYLGVKVLQKLGVPVETKEFQCGCDFYGVDNDRIGALVKVNLKVLSGYGTVIVGCARCLQVFRRYYNIKARHMTEVIAERLEELDQKFIGSGNVIYHDPCFLARYAGITEEPREILKRLGYNVIEFANNREGADCCGDYTLLQAMRARGATLRLGQTTADGIVTAGCPKCTQNFLCFNKANSKITVKPFLELVDYALNMDMSAGY
jgi:Fe-S oxidoreductase